MVPLELNAMILLKLQNRKYAPKLALANGLYLVEYFMNKRDS